MVLVIVVMKRKTVAPPFTSYVDHQTISCKLKSPKNVSIKSDFLWNALRSSKLINVYTHKYSTSWTHINFCFLNRKFKILTYRFKIKLGFYLMDYDLLFKNRNGNESIKSRNQFVQYLNSLTKCWLIFWLSLFDSHWNLQPKAETN